MPLRIRHLAAVSLFMTAMLVAGVVLAPACIEISCGSCPSDEPVAFQGGHQALFPPMWSMLPPVMPDSVFAHDPVPTILPRALAYAPDVGRLSTRLLI